MSDTDSVLPTDNGLLASLVQAVLPKIAQAILGIGRTKMYDELGKGNLAAVKDGPRILITTESIARYQAIPGSIGGTAEDAAYRAAVFGIPYGPRGDSSGFIG